MSFEPLVKCPKNTFTKCIAESPTERLSGMSKRRRKAMTHTANVPTDTITGIRIPLPKRSKAQADEARVGMAAGRIILGMW